MELKEFISETLVQIIEGINKAQIKAKESNAEINPDLVGNSDHTAKYGGGIRTAGGNYAQIVEFDVAVTTAEGKNVKGGIGVAAAVINMGSSGQSNSENTSVNKIKFSIPLVLPPS